MIRISVLKLLTTLCRFDITNVLNSVCFNRFFVFIAHRELVGDGRAIAPPTPTTPNNAPDRNVFQVRGATVTADDVSR